MAKTDNATGSWIDAFGNKVPQKYIKPVDRIKEKALERLIKEAKKAAETLVKLRELADNEIDGYLHYAATEAGLKENPKGNYTLTGFSGDIQVERKQAEFIAFDEHIQFAKSIIDGCLERWSAGAHANLKVLIQDSFKVNGKGQLDKNRILSLQRIHIKDNEWEKAMDLINKSVKIGARKTYIIFRVRDEQGKWQTIPLDIARV